MVQQVPISRDAIADLRVDGPVHEVAPDLAYLRLAIVNVVLCGERGAGDRHWVLVDAGLSGSAATIAQAAAHRFGDHARPAAIVLTHAHFDHVGALPQLLERWDCPVFAHQLEAPYLTGRINYPPPDVSAGGGLMSRLSILFPRGPIDISPHLSILPPDGTVPPMGGWRWVHTPGHTPGHISLWRGQDRTVIAGDAFITTAQESAYAALTQRPEVHGPPRYFTPDWESARDSVRTLASLEPELAICGHGRAMRGEELRHALHRLADNFDDLALPPHLRGGPMGHSRWSHT
jgi:glyoxylase-like metal-dependent hydrolase (beta-lactamase superfamily II)